ncbi:hypothetical protein M426DRAFT_318110 [Hypoxylon sp. CI-4A]|nr:hypothetical protein M426DRAFT_318110 [Hypoxylon sp. CI-4A]
MDLFSFGMLCLWFIFEPRFSGILPLPESPQPTPSLHENDEDRAVKIIAHLKDLGIMQSFAQKLVMEIDDLDGESKEALRHLFTGCIAYDPEFRGSSFLHILPTLRIPKYKVSTLIT